MDTAGAIEAGSGYVNFFGKWSDLSATMGEIEQRLNTWAARFQTQTVSAANSAAASLQTATASAATFGTTGTAAGVQTSAALQQTTTAGNQVAGTFSRISQNAMSAAGAAAGFISRATSLRAIGGFLMNIDGTLGRIGRTATIAGLSMKGMAFAGKLFGLNTAGLNATASNLLRIGRYSTIASFGLWGILGPARLIGSTMATASSVGSAAWRRMLAIIRATPGAITGVAGAFSSVGRGALGRVGRMGGRMAGLAGIGAAVASPTGQADGGGGSSMFSGILTGLAIGGPVGAAAVGLGMFIKNALANSTAEGGSAAGGFLANLGERMRAYGSWAGGIWDQVKEKIVSTFRRADSTGTSVLSRLEQAIYPIVDAVQNVWLPAFMNGMDTIKAFFNRSTGEMGRTWTDWIVDAVAGVADFIGNFDIYFQMAQQTVVMWASNAILRMSDFFTNMGKWLEWFGGNWKDVFFTAFDLAATVFINIGKNIRTLFEKIWNWVRSGFTEELNLTDADWKPLTDGFVSTIKEWPDLVQTELANSTPELEALYAKLGQRQADAAARAATATANIVAAGVDPKNMKSNQTSVSSLNSFAAARLGGNDGGFAARTARAAEETASNTRKMADKPGLVWS